MNDNEYKRGLLVTQIVKIGLTQCIREGLLDALFNDKDDDGLFEKLSKDVESNKELISLISDELNLNTNSLNNVNKALTQNTTDHTGFNTRFGKIEATATETNRVVGVLNSDLREGVQALANKADLVSGKIPLSQLPASVTHKVVNGAVTSTTPLTIDCGNVRFVLSWNSATSIKCGARAISGTQFVDFRSTSMYTGSGVDSYAYDGVSLNETVTVFDAEYYTNSNECTFWRLRENNRVWEIKCFASGGASRVTLWADLISP